MSEQNVEPEFPPRGKTVPDEGCLFRGFLKARGVNLPPRKKKPQPKSTSSAQDEWEANRE
jgi:hypothetical protein